MKKQMLSFGSVIVFVFLITIIFTINSVCAQMLLSDMGVKYEDRILEEFNKTDGFVDLIIYPKNVLDKESLISSFSKDEIGRVINRNISAGIVMEMNEDAFFKLILDEIVESVYFNAPVEALLEESAELVHATDAWYTLGYNGTGVRVCE